ncbi:MAG: T9SS type A sorting domain-containing protein [Bacteroidota bacterium]|nr:T9SS type A sorting domain-containing protein [Bacteroidota bacterium]
MKKSILIITILLSQLNLTAQFKPTAGPSGGAQATCFLKDGSIMYAGIQSGLYKTTDNGTTWTKLTVAADASDFKALAKAGSFVFAASNNGKIRMYKSNDGGNTWIGVQNGLPQAGGNAVFSPTQMAVIKDTLFLGTTTAGVLKTADFGANWVPTVQGGCTNAVFAKGDTLVIGGAGIGRPKWSTNKGATLTDFASDIYKPLPTLPFNNCMAIDYRNGRLFFITSYAAPVFYTDDWGATIVSSTGVSSPNTIEVADSKIYVSATDYNKCYVSSDNGTTFTEEKIDGNSAGATVFYYDGSQIWVSPLTWSAAVGTTYFGIYSKPVANTNWQGKNNGLNYMNITQLIGSGNNVFAITGAKLYKSTDMGASWNLADTNLYTNIASDGNSVYACKDIGVNKSTDNGATWSAINYFNGKAVTAFFAEGQLMIAGVSNSSGPEVWMSSDGGSNWSQKTVTGQSGWTSKVIKDFHKHSTNAWLAEMNAGFILTTDAGASWAWKNPLSFGGYFATQGNRLLYQRDYELYVSDNNGSTFRTFHTGMPAAPWPICGGLFVQGSTAYVYNTSGNMGLWGLASVDTIWKYMGNTNGMATYPKIAMISVNGKIFAAPQNASIWKLDSAAVGVENNISKNNILVNVYPNPVMAGNEIIFDIQNEGSHTINIYAIDGREIHSVNSNTNQTKIKLSNPATGIYIYTLKGIDGLWKSGKFIIE